MLFILMEVAYTGHCHFYKTLFNNNINMINNRNNEIQSSYDNNTTDDGTSEQEKDNDISELE